MKYEFKDSRYVRMFEESDFGRQVVSTILQDPNLIRSNFGFWKQFFPADPTALVTTNAGNAAVSVTARQPEHATMADWRAPLGDSRLGEEGAAERYNASIIDLITLGWQETALEREDKEKIFADYGSDAPLLLGYATNVLQPRIDSIDMSLSNMAAQAMSTGRVIYTGGKIIKGNVYEAPIPAENKCTAGEKVWSDPDCNILEQMATIEKHYKEDVFGKPNMAMEWIIPYSVFTNILLKNKYVVEYIKINWLADKGQLISQVASVPASVITEDAFNTYVIGRYPGLSPIKVVDEKQFDDGQVVNGWKSGTVVLHARGNCGRTYRTSILDRTLSEKYGNNLVAQVFSTTMNGIATVCNTTMVNGKYKEWATDVYASATPVLETFLTHILVNISVADA